MVLDASLLNTQHHKVWIKGKVEQSREKKSRPPLYLGVVAIEKGAFGSPSTTVTKFPFTYFLLRCSTRPNEWGTQWDSNLLLKVSKSSLLTIKLPRRPSWSGSKRCTWHYHKMNGRRKLSFLFYYLEQTAPNSPVFDVPVTNSGDWERGFRPGSTTIMALVSCNSSVLCWQPT